MVELCPYNRLSVFDHFGTPKILSKCEISKCKLINLQDMNKWDHHIADKPRSTFILSLIQAENHKAATNLLIFNTYIVHTKSSKKYGMHLLYGRTEPYVVE